jgi:fluoroacetyl-CoA thioesterase
MKMNYNLNEGIKGYKEMIVVLEATAARFGSGLVEVFATPAMVALMEGTSQFSIQDLLPEGYITVGTELNIKHLKATPKDKKVWCESELIKIEGRKLTFRVDAWDEQGKIGTGTHQRFVVHGETFMKKLLAP